MDLTIDQVLQKAVDAHKAGKLQDAESLYRAILRVQPNHPDANHNLGVLVISVNKSEAVLPLFKTALDANPNQEQFWLSYIDALINTNQLEIAKSVLEQGKKLGLAGERVVALEVQLSLNFSKQRSQSLSESKWPTIFQQRKKNSIKKDKKGYSPKNLITLNQSRSPPSIKLNSLLEYYQKGQLDLGLNLATALTEQYPKHPFGWKVLGALFQQMGKLKESVIATQKALNISPNDAEAFNNLGIALQQHGRLEEALVGYKKAIAIKPDYAQAHFNLGNGLKELGKLEDAEISYKKAISFKPAYPEAHSNLGITLQKLGRLEDAEASYKKAIEIKPDYAQAYYNLGITLHELNRLEDGVISYKKAIAINPDYADAYNNIGNTLKEIGRLEDAETSYKNAIAIKPDFLEAHSNLGNTLKDLGRPEDAAISYKKAIAINPDFPEVHYNLGLLLKELGRLVDAETSYKKAIVLKPDYAQAYCNLGVTLQELGRLEDAETIIKKAIAIKPDYAQAHYNLGNLLKNFGRLGDAEISYKKAILFQPDYPEAHSNLGNTLKDLGRLEQAVASYKKSISINPNYAQAHSNLGITLKEIGNLAEAEASYKKAIAIKSNYPEVYYNLGILLKEDGRLGEAQTSFEQAVKLKPDFIKARNEMLNGLYLLDEKSSFYDALDYFIKEDIANSVIGSLTCRSALRYGEQKRNIFCNDPLNHVLLIDLKSRCDFEVLFSQNIKYLLSENKISNRRQTTLLNGFQTSGNVFSIKNNYIDEIQRVIRSEIEQYRINFENSQEGLIRKWPHAYNLYGWLICMKSGGELLPHIHETGWLSGSVYINVPPKSELDSGSLVVALGKDSDATHSRQNSKKVIDVVSGSMALFPASLMHHTIPFENYEDRIVLAFDVVPQS
jgi:tetratricopeptide (TPR) repeat protein